MQRSSHRLICSLGTVSRNSERMCVCVCVGGGSRSGRTLCRVVPFLGHLGFRKRLTLEDLRAVAVWRSGAITHVQRWNQTNNYYSTEPDECTRALWIRLSHNRLIVRRSAPTVRPNSLLILTLLAVFEFKTRQMMHIQPEVYDNVR